MVARELAIQESKRQYQETRTWVRWVGFVFKIAHGFLAYKSREPDAKSDALCG